MPPQNPAGPPAGPPAAPRVALPTIVGLALLLMPLCTMLHEIGGHSAMCVALGYKVTELGSFYINCSSPPGTMAMRAVALAGPGIDTLVGLVFLAGWHRLRGDWARLIGWYVGLGCAFSASGYLLFSGVTGLGDLGPSGEGGLAPLPLPYVWRGCFAVVGAATYAGLVMVGMRRLTAMIGNGPETKRARRNIAHGFYAALCVAAVLASLPNPMGLVITLTSAAAASIGGHAGLIAIGYATRNEGEPRAFVIGRRLWLLALGIAASFAFALILGSTIGYR